MYINYSKRFYTFTLFQEVARFLDAKHDGSYLIFDLCSRSS